MHVVIAGCGRVGAQLAASLSGQGHSVAVIDKAPESFRRLGDDFPGERVVGFAFDRGALEKAGIRRAQAFVAVTSGDNSNVVSARAALDHYGVDHVVARIYDPERADIYERLGLTTIASTRWTTEAVLRALLPPGERVDHGIGPGEGDVALLTMQVPPAVRSVPAADLARPGEVVVVAISRGGRTVVPPGGAVLEAGDHVHLAVQRDALDAATARITELLEEER